MNNLHTIQEASLGGSQWFDGHSMEFDFGTFQAVIFPPDRLSPQWFVLLPDDEFWCDSLAFACDWLSAMARDCLR